VRGAVIRFNRHLLNPVMLRFAGGGSFYAAVIRHEGRRSGRPYATPVVAEPVGGGFVIPLPYGEEADWCRNVLAAGRATVVLRGRTSDVTGPELVDAAVALPRLPLPRRVTYRLLGVRRFLVLRPADGGAGVEEQRRPAPGQVDAGPAAGGG